MVKMSSLTLDQLAEAFEQTPRKYPYTLITEQDLMKVVNDSDKIKGVYDVRYYAGIDYQVMSVVCNEYIEIRSPKLRVRRVDWCNIDWNAFTIIDGLRRESDQTPLSSDKDIEERMLKI